MSACLARVLVAASGWAVALLWLGGCLFDLTESPPTAACTAAHSAECWFLREEGLDACRAAGCQWSEACMLLNCPQIEAECTAPHCAWDGGICRLLSIEGLSACDANLDSASCQRDEQCGFDLGCHGTPTPCSTFKDSSACLQSPLCEWEVSDDSPLGSAPPVRSTNDVVFAALLTNRFTTTLRRFID